MYVQLLIIGFSSILLASCGTSGQRAASDEKKIAKKSQPLSVVNETRSSVSMWMLETPFSHHFQVKEKVSDYNTIWPHIESQLTFGEELAGLPTVRRHIKTLLRSPKQLQATTRRAEPFLPHIIEEVQRHNMPIEIALLPFVESRFYALARNPRSKAGGIWQFTRATGRFYGLDQNWWYDARFDVRQSTRAALNLLQDLHDRYDDWLLALAAYNWGMGNVDKSIRKSRKRGVKSISYWSIRLPRETRNYVPKLIAYAQIIAKQAEYGITLHPVEKKPSTAWVPISKPYEMSQLAEAANLSVHHFRQLNAGFRRWAVKPNNQYHVLLPADVVSTFQSRLKNPKLQSNSKWTSHIVERGDSLYKIAHHYGITVRTIKRVNRLDTSVIRIGQRLIIPVRQSI